MAPVVLEYAKSGNVGVSKTVKAEGDGRKPKMGEVALVTYSGFLDDGQVKCSGQKKEVQLGKRALWGTGADLALVSMKVGERAMVRCEAEFAGADIGSPPITLDLRLERIVGDGIGFTPMEVKMIKRVGMVFLAIVLYHIWKELHFFKRGLHDSVHDLFF